MKTMRTASPSDVTTPPFLFDSHMCFILPLLLIIRIACTTIPTRRAKKKKIGKPRKESRKGREISGNPTTCKPLPMLSTLGWKRADLTIDAGCDACALPVITSILSELMDSVRQVLMKIWFRRQKS